MNAPEPTRSFEAARRRHLIHATIEALADVGFKAASLNQIARRANVSTGLFAHYFGDKDGLLEATLRFMAGRLVQATRRRLRAAKTPRERVYAVPDSALADQEFERRTSAVWLAFWGQITHSARYQRIQIIYQQRMLSNLRHDLRALVPPERVADYATMIASMIDGVWIRSHASPTQADGREARAMVRALIDALIDGDAARADPARDRRDRTPARPSPTSEERPCTAASPDASITAAVTAARAGFALWSAATPLERERALRRSAELLRAEATIVAEMTAREAGRSVTQTLEALVPRAAQALERWAALASQTAATRIDLGHGMAGHMQRDPLGVVAGFCHWSAPVFGACRQAAPALALGNAMVFSTGAHTAESARHLASLLERAGIPPGVFTPVRGNAAVHARLATHLDLAGPTHEALPPKSATIIFGDADMAMAATALLHGCRRWTHTPDYSENCVFVEKSAISALTRHLTAGLDRLRHGDPRDPAMHIGHLVSSAHLQDVHAKIADAVELGAKIVVGVSGRPAAGGHDLSFAPTLIKDCRVGFSIVQTQLFAPVLMLIGFADCDELAAQVAGFRQDASFGLFCADHRLARHVGGLIPSGRCCVNDYRPGVAEDADWRFDFFGTDARDLERFSRLRRTLSRNDD